MEVKPLKTLDELLKWKFPKELKLYTDRISPLAPRSPPVCLTSTPLHPSVRTLVCHDMRNGYLDDRFCAGTDKDDAYRFYNWSSLDLFVYFSHHLVTIPPVGWTQAAHIHGVKVLGTLITEWEEGADLWDEILCVDRTINTIIHQLVLIAQLFKFDGWLLNIENTIKPEKMNKMLQFVSGLRKSIREMDASSEVIWYDSITIKGDLKWQNELNVLNKPFFDICDGIFLNYTWNEENLTNSRKLAGERKADVFVGIDVFGRNFYKGGGFNSYMALELIRRYSMSAAIFAQGWTYDVFSPDGFTHNENKMWKSFEPYLLYHGPRKLPLSTSFSQGFGKRYFEGGRVVREGGWYNLFKQTVQPIWEGFSRDDTCFSLVTDQAYEGGSCVAFWVTAPVTIRLLICQLEIIRPLEISFMYKCLEAPKELSFVLSIHASLDTDVSTHIKNFHLVCEKCEKDSSCNDTSNSAAGKDQKGNFHVKPTSSKEENSWITKVFRLPRFEFKKFEISSVKLQAEGPAVIYIGKLLIEELFAS